MAGFKKSKAFEQIRVPMIVNTADESGLQLEQVEVAHVFRVPLPEVREEWQRTQLQQKGKRFQLGHKSEANFVLWLKTIITVEGYDDLDLKNPDWKRYFDDPIGRIHVDNAVDMFMNILTSDEVEQEKKLEQSSELLSTATKV